PIVHEIVAAHLIHDDEHDELRRRRLRHGRRAGGIERKKNDHRQYEPFHRHPRTPGLKTRPTRASTPSNAGSEDPAYNATDHPAPRTHPFAPTPHPSPPSPHPPAPNTHHPPLPRRSTGK